MGFPEETGTDFGGAAERFSEGSDAVPGGPEAPLLADTPADRLADYCLLLGDDAFVMSRRLQYWCGRTLPAEDGQVMAGAALDLLEQAFHFYTRAGFAGGHQFGADHYAFCRAEANFRNATLAELECARFGKFIAVLLLFTTWRCCLFHRLLHSSDAGLRWIAEAGMKKLEEHQAYAANWAELLGNRTPEARQRLQKGLDAAWGFVDELFLSQDPVHPLVGVEVAPDSASVRADFEHVLADVLATASITVPDVPSNAPVGRKGLHTKEMEILLGRAREFGCESCPGPTTCPW